MFVDNHCHINSLSEEVRKDVLESRRRFIFIDSSIDYVSSISSISISSKSRFIFSCLGFHPLKLDTFTDRTLEDYQRLLEENKDRIIGIGEIGIDCKAPFPLQEQIRVFEKFIELAKRYDLVVIIHNRYDKPVVLDVLDDFFLSYDRVVFHCFSQDESFLENILKKNGFVSFSLNILRNKRRIINSLLRTPLDRLLLETDSPYMKIEGKYSTPFDIERCYKFVSEIRNIDIEELSNRILSNVITLYKLQNRFSFDIKDCKPSNA